MNSNEIKPEVTVLVVIGPHLIIEQIDKELKEAGINTSFKTRKRGVPLAGAVISIEGVRSIRQTAVPIVRRIIAAMDDKKGSLCTAAFFSFFADLEYSETCIIWSKDFINKSVDPDEENRNEALAETNGRIFVIDYSVDREAEQKKQNIPNKMNLCFTNDARKLFNELQNKVKVTIGKRGLVLSNNLQLPWVIWTDGNGNLLFFHEKTSLPSMAELAFMDKGVCSRALENGFVVWTHENNQPWYIPGTLGSKNDKYIKAVVQDTKDKPLQECIKTQGHIYPGSRKKEQ